MVNDSAFPSWILLNAGTAQVGSEWCYRNVCSPFMRLYYIIEGEGHVIFPNHTLIMKPGHIYMVPPYTRHSNYCADYMNHVYLHIYNRVDKNSASLTDNWILPDQIPVSWSTKTIFNVLVRQNSRLELVNHNPMKYDNYPSFTGMLNTAERQPYITKMQNNALISLIITDWLQYSNRRTEIKNAYVANAISYMRRNYSNKISLDDLTEKTPVSTHHISRLFKQETGLSAGAYLLNLRMRRAQEALIYTSTSIKTIATDVGYDDYNYFIRMFKKVTGMTPKEFRNQDLSK